MKYSNVIFDLDGTLINSEEGIIKSAKYALSKMGIEENDLTVLRSFIGPPLVDSFIQTYGLSEDLSKKTVEYYRERYSDVGYKENSLYDGVAQMLRALYNAGVKLYIASSKPEYYVKKIIQDHGLDNLFTFMAGASLDRSRDNKEAVLDYLMKEGDLNKDNAVMIGDTKYDIIGAHFTELECIAVTYGFGTREVFIKHGADYIVDTPQEIVKIVLDN